MKNKKQDKKELEKLLNKLEESSKKILESRGYIKESKKIKILEEMIKEQIRNENSYSTIS